MMKTDHLIIIAALFITQLGFSQTTTENHIYGIDYQIAVQPSGLATVAMANKIEAVQYFDGLGRPEQTVMVRFGAAGQHNIVPFVYDAYGRQAKDYLPYATTTSTNGNFNSNAITEHAAFYNTAKFGSTTNPWSETLFEPSPLDRPKEQGAPGAPWLASATVDTDRTIKYQYLTNTTADAVKRYVVTFSGTVYDAPTLTDNGIYAANELYMNMTKDENWQSTQTYLNNNTVQEFKDKQGRVVLKRNFTDTDLNLNGTLETTERQVPHDTYYVYDRFGNLTYVVPPKVITSDGVSATELSELCYQYKYDDRGRVIEKKIPGKGWEYIVYNVYDQPVLTKDANLHAQGKWRFTKYDAFGRVSYSGLANIVNTTARATLQTAANAVAVPWVVQATTTTAIASTNVYYTGEAYPLNSTIGEVQTINYYDSYVANTVDGLDGGVTEASYTVTPITNVKGLPTVAKVRTLGTTNWTTTVTYYDAKARPIYIFAKDNYLATTDKIKSKVHFTGRVEETTTDHIRTGFTTLTTVEKYTYDAMARLTKQTHQITGKPEETIAQNVYDELGALLQKKVGNTVALPLQTVDYKYNVRGWLKQLNDANAIGTDLFAMTLNYNTPTTGTALFNGNISQAVTTTLNTDQALKTYSYSYDALNRIKGAAHTNANYALNNVDYDKNGNIAKLRRQGQTNAGATTFGTMDDLTYTYDAGNKLTIISDIGSDAEGARDDMAGTGADTTTDYTYDTNGNMITDTNKGITAISYNQMNLPLQVTITGGTIAYAYDATGTKKRKTVTQGATVTITEYANGKIYEKVGAAANTLKFLDQPEGYISANAGAYAYVYQHKDHLGNARVNYKNNSGNQTTVALQIQEENNFYPFGLEHKGYNSGIVQEYNFKNYNGKELDKSLGLNLIDYGARSYDPALGRWMNLDPLAEHPNQLDKSPYAYAWNNPVYYDDPDGECPNCVTGLIGAGIGALIGGGIEIASQLYKNGSVSDWKAVGGSAVQGAVTGGAAGFTGGASLLATAAVAGTANAVGGTANRAIQGKETTLKDVAIDATVGAAFGGAGHKIGKALEGATNNLSNSAKGKLGELVTEIKYGAQGYKSQGKAVVDTGGKTATGKVERAFYDHKMENIFTGNKLTVESKFNTSGLTKNQSKAIPEIKTPGGLKVDVTTSSQLGNTLKTVITGSSGQIKF